MNAYIKTAKEAARRAGKILRDGFQKRHRLSYKKANFQAIVTEVDLAAELAMIQTIRRAHPTHRILSEERGLANNTDSPYLWILDPLDGTTNYVHGVPFFNTTLALQKQGKTILGIVYQPVTEEFFFAVRGGGTWLNTKRCSVSRVSHQQKAYGFIEWTAEDQTINTRGLRIFTRLRKSHIRVRNIGSGALTFAYVAAGHVEYGISVDSHIWDVAAGSLLIREAGGRVTDFDGRNPDAIWEKNPRAKVPLLVSNGKMHKTLFRFVS